MQAQLQAFLSRKKPTLQIFCPDQHTVVTSFESYLPNSNDVGKLSDADLDLPARLCWVKDGYDYYAYLPKERLFDGHLLEPLKRHKPKLIKKDGRFFVDDETRELWLSLDNNLASSIGAVGVGILVDLEHHEPRKAINFGFSRGHKTEHGLQRSLKISKNAFVHRLAYLVYLISYRYQWDAELVDQQWWNALGARCGRTWVDSVWDAVYRQWEARDFIGVVVRPGSSSVRWLKSALSFGVPIWIWLPALDGYDRLDGGSVVKPWIPPQAEIDESRRAAKAKLEALLAKSTMSPSLSDDPMDLSTEPPADTAQDPLVRSGPLSPPAQLPLGTSWYESWEVFFRNRGESNRKKLEVATDPEKKVWESREQSAKKFQSPGKSGPRVYAWESCDSGGFLRVLQSRHDAAEGWEFWDNEALIFDPQHNVWDHCPFMWEPAVEDGPPDDVDDEGDRRITEHWYTEPDLPATLPDDNPSPLDFLYSRYGFLSIDPTPASIILPFKKASGYRIVGLEADSYGEYPKHLNSFLTSVLGGRVPEGHCDLSITSPPNEMFGRAFKRSIQDTVFLSAFPDLSEGVVFTFISAENDSQPWVVHDSLSVLQVARAGIAPKLEAQVNQLLFNGSRFTLLYPRTQPLVSPRFTILTFPIRGATWQPDKEDFRAYMSRVRTFFHERPYAVAAAFSRGGIAWRIAREVLGIEGSFDALRNTYPNQGSSVRVKGNNYWFHELDEGEWFYLVGGYEILTGL